ncbi:hypothetical protein [Epilithonimonas zeae]|uniref:hypothetical protein n=1 Tax=Epilithonimonas zeae TaxID=1416779 RepID=UPI00200DC74C|nr:hypothetical protein [Epilithonimonas zeae]UQB69382.1 hypothetical protein KI430_02835 [Epilithonimonas zeae]
MNFEKLNIDISYPQRIEIIIEFLLKILGKYNGLGNLDKTWDDNIMPIINQSITESGAYIKKSKLEITRKSVKEKLSYNLSLIVNALSLNLSCIKDDLTKHNFQTSLRIIRVYENGNLETLYADTYYIDKHYIDKQY